MQKLEDESIPKIGGARWKSAREDRGSVGNYAKDVQDRQQRALKKKGTMDLLTGQFIKTNNVVINDDSSKYDVSSNADAKYNSAYIDTPNANYQMTSMYIYLCVFWLCNLSVVLVCYSIICYN